MPSDKEYKHTKKILLGDSKMNPDFIGIARWIDDKYKVKTLNIIYDTIDNGNLPRLQVIFEFEKEAKSFERSRFVYDKKKQDGIARQFKAEMIKKEHIKSRFYSTKSKYETHNLLVIFSAFEPISMIETNEAIPESSINKLKTEINNPDLWEISRCFARTTFFLYTEKQVEDYEKKGFRQTWSKMYFDLLKDYDKFGYFKLDRFSIYLDSKENFDNNYQGNWFYYDR